MNGEASELEKEKEILKTALCIYKAEQEQKESVEKDR